MKIYQVSWLLGMLSFVVFGLLTRPSSPLANTSTGTQNLIALLLVALPAGIGTVLGVRSMGRREANPWWIIGAVVLNAAMLLGGVVFLLPG